MTINLIRMKVVSILILSLIPIASLYAQFDEYPKIITSSRDNYYGQIKITDIDNDGFKDLMAFENIDLKIFKNGGNLFKSQNRKKTYWSELQTGIHPYDFADLNADNLPELIYYSSEYSNVNKGLYLKKNLGNGDFGPDVSLNIPISASTVKDLKLFDMNADGNRDIVFMASNTISIYYGTSNFGIFQSAVNVFYDANAYIQQFDIADLNNDNTPDIVFTYCDNNYTQFSINILKQSGSSFLNSNLILVQNNPLSNLHLADINNDGKTDLIFQLQNANEIAIATNTGNLSFTQYYLQSANYLSFDLADINGDNFQDIVLGKDDQLNYFPNNQGSFSAAVLPVTGNITEATKLFCEDFNNDGKADFLFIRETGYSYVKLIINENGSFGYTTALSKSINDTDITSLDFDHNGTTDLILPNCWISNETNGEFGACNFFNNTSADFMTYSAIGDLDQDGDNDVAGIVNDQLFIFTNQGNNYDFTPVLVESSVCGMVDLQDINGDGKLDLFYILINYPDPNSPVVYRLNQNNSWSSPIFITNISSPLTRNYKKIQFTDLNADSKPDFVFPEDYSLRFFTNTGNGFSESSVQINGVELFVKDYKYILTDFNMDGAQDIVMTIYGADYKYYLNLLLNDGDMNFSIQNLSDPMDGIVPVFDLNDYDGDYDLDLFCNRGLSDNRYYVNHSNTFDLYSFESISGYGPGVLNTIHSTDLFGNASRELIYTQDKMVIVRENLTTPYFFSTNNGFIYPNPSNSVISFGVAFNQLQTYTVQIFSVIGNPELSGIITNETNFLDISSLSSGLHLAKIINNSSGEVIQTNFIKN